MKSFLKSVATGLLAVALAASAAFAQDRPAFRQEELDQMLAPIALYPDSLLSQVLMAATYPLEVVQAARWSRSNPQLKGQDAVRAVEPMDWDPSVKSLVAFPQVLHRMDEQLDWTQRLGEAFLAQEPHVMDAIQGLRQRAATAGNLRSNEQMRVARQDEHILIEPAHPQVVYVPYYDPAVVYGPWWWPAYPPVFWGPPPGYYVAPGYWPGFFWGSGIVISTGFFFGHFHWPHRHVTVVHKPVHHVVVDHRTVINRTHVVPDHKLARWQHDPRHRKGVPYRHVVMRDDFRRPVPSTGDARRDHHSPDAAPIARHPAGGRPAGVREGPREEPRESGVSRDVRESAPHRVPPQSNDRRGDGRDKAHFGRDMRESRPAQPQAQGRNWDREMISDLKRAPSRSMPPPAAPVVATPRTDPRPAGAAPNGHDRQARIPRPISSPDLRGIGDRGHVGRAAETTRESVPFARGFQSSGSPKPRMAHGNNRAEGAARGRGGSSFR